MDYTIKYGESSFGSYEVSLDAVGNKYIVYVWMKGGETSMIGREEFDNYRLAELRFYGLCKMYNVADVIEVEHDPADFDFD